MELVVESAVTFNFVQRREVCQFLKKYPDVAIALGRLPPVVAKTCPGTREIFLRVTDRNDQNNDVGLIAQIPQDCPTELAQSKVKEISCMWWVNLPEEVRSRIGLDTISMKEAS